MNNTHTTSRLLKPHGGPVMNAQQTPRIGDIPAVFKNPHPVGHKLPPRMDHARFLAPRDALKVFTRENENAPIPSRFLVIVNNGLINHPWTRDEDGVLTT